MDPRFKAVLGDVPTYGRFLSVWEIDQIVSHISTLPGVQLHKIGKTIDGEDIPMLEIGSGSRTCIMVGVPHSDEPLGSLVTTFFAMWLATHPEDKCFGWRWLILPIMERTGMRLNEGWFNLHEDYTAMAKTYFREPTEDQYEWTFPIDYEGYRWDDPRPETMALMHVLKKERPDILYGLHNTGFHDAYYYLSEDVPEVYPELRRLSSKVRIPLSDNVPDVPFTETYAHGFFAMYGLRDYIEFYKSDNPELLKAMRRGACSDEWYKHSMGGFSFNCEVPMYRSPKSMDTRPSGRTMGAILDEEYKRHKTAVGYAVEMMRKIEPYSDLADQHLHEAASNHVKSAQESLSSLKREVSDPEDRIASFAEVFEHGPLSDVSDLLHLGQVWRVMESICLSGGPSKLCRFMDMAEMWIRSLGKSVGDSGGFYRIPIKSGIKLQLGSVLLIADALERRNRR